MKNSSVDYKPTSTRDLPVYLFTYHKVGSVLLRNIFSEISKKYNWKFTVLLGWQEKAPSNSDIVLFAHSQVNPEIFKGPFRGVHFIRDPRDIIISGYFYHLRTTEKWCTNSKFTRSRPILFPNVPYSQQHRGERWKEEYLNELAGKSYKDNLLSRPQYEAILFEMNHYAAWTIQDMREWNYNLDNVLEIKFEELMNDYDETFTEIFKHLLFTKNQLYDSLKIAQQHDLNRKTDDEIKAITHVTSRNTTKWKEYFDPQLEQNFNKKFGDILKKFEYPEF